MRIVVINGYPESGKDEFILAAEKSFKCEHHSTIDKCKFMAIGAGWNGVKDDDSRLMLSNLKKWYVKHFDGVMKDIIELYRTLDNKRDFMFIVSREGNEIERIRSWCGANGVPFTYIFLKRNEKRDFGNDSDNNVLQGSMPDLVFHNTGDSIDELHDKVVVLLNNLSST